MHLLNPVTHLKTAFYVILSLASEAIESFRAKYPKEINEFLRRERSCK